MPRGVAGPLQQDLEERRREVRARIPSEETTPVSEELADLLGHVVGGAMPEIRGVLRQIRARPVEMRNTDGEPMELIAARVRLRNRLKAEDAMEAHPEISSEPDIRLRRDRGVFIGESDDSCRQIAVRAQRQWR